jgi:hypothetical protein
VSTDFRPFEVQIDCPDLAMGRHIQYANLELSEFRSGRLAHRQAQHQRMQRFDLANLLVHLRIAPAIHGGDSDFQGPRTSFRVQSKPSACPLAMVTGIARWGPFT